MTGQNYSLEGLYSFIDYIIDKGLVKTATAKNWKNAASRLFSISDAAETGDLRKIDVDKLCRRYANIKGKDATRGSLNVYRSRLKSALKDFVKYTDDPMKYSPGISERASRSKKSNSTTSKNVEVKHKENRNTTHGQKFSDPDPGFVSFPIPLRKELTVEIVNLPFDLNELEAEKIAAVVKALAVKK